MKGGYMINYELKKQMEHALLNGRYDEALELSRQLDKQILEIVKNQIEYKETKMCK